MKLFSLIAVAVALALQFHSARAQAPARTDQVRTVYEEPTDEKHRITRQLMQERRILETVAALLNSFRLPRELTLEVRGCNGRENAWYGFDRAIFCYEYVDLIQRHAPKVATPGGVQRADAIVGAVIDTLFHEAAHGIFDLLRDSRDGARGGRGRLLLDLSDAAVSARRRPPPDRRHRVQHGQRGAQGLLGAAAAAEVRRAAWAERAASL